MTHSITFIFFLLKLMEDMQYYLLSCRFKDYFLQKMPSSQAVSLVATCFFCVMFVDFLIKKFQLTSVD